MNLRLEKRIAAARINEMQIQLRYLQRLVDVLTPTLRSLEINISDIETRIEAEKASVNNPVDTQSESK